MQCGRGLELPQERPTVMADFNDDEEADERLLVAGGKHQSGGRQ
jgi:hypothetical protein